MSDEVDVRSESRWESAVRGVMAGEEASTSSCTVLERGRESGGESTSSSTADVGLQFRRASVPTWRDWAGTPASRSDATQPQCDSSQPEMVCRFCLVTGGDDLISPCMCRGTQKYVHRSCLDSWRAAKGWFALTHCSICKAPFHLCLPRRPSAWFILSATLRCFVAALLFALLHLGSLVLGFGAAKGPLYPQSMRSLFSDSTFHRYCVGFWDLITGFLFPMGLVVKDTSWRIAFCVANILLKHTAIVPAVAGVIDHCRANAHLLPPSFPLLLRPHLTSTALNVPALLPRCTSRWDPMTEYFAMASCGAHTGAAVFTVAVGLAYGACVVYQVLKLMGRFKSKCSRMALVKELEVLDVKGEYSPPSLTHSQQRQLQALELLA